ncbi:MAG: thioredoxin family protein [Phycisphaerales bacterium]|nr:thioredoxin family protein [Phycisphaerales bacterium]
MAATPSTMVPLGTAMPSFDLPDPAGVRYSPSIGQKNGHLIIFMCNHCPFVIHVADLLAELGRDFPNRGIEIIGINSNDITKYPDDAPPRMATEAEARNWTFPYLFDETQTVAKAFEATCTPDIFLYDDKGRLFYRGQLDDTRPSDDVPATGSDIHAAVDALLTGNPPPGDQRPSIGCNIKWK